MPAEIGDGRGAPSHWRRTLPTTTDWDRSQCCDLLWAICSGLAERSSEEVAHLYERAREGRLAAARLHVGTALPGALPLRVTVDPKRGAVGETVAQFAAPLECEGEWAEITTALREIGERIEAEGADRAVELGFTYRLRAATPPDLRRTSLDRDPLEGPPWERVEALAARLSETGVVAEPDARCTVATECYGYPTEAVAARLDLSDAEVEAARERGLDRLRGSREVVEALREAGRADRTIRPVGSYSSLGRFDTETDFEYADHGRHAPDESLCGRWFVSPDAAADTVLSVVDEVRDPADGTVRAYVVHHAPADEFLLASPGWLDASRERGELVEGTVEWPARSHYEAVRAAASADGPLATGEPERDAESLLAEAREALAAPVYRDLERRLRADEDVDIR